MQTETILIAIGSPAVLAIMTHILSRRSTLKEWARQDKLETKKQAAAEETAKLLLASNERIATTAAHTAKETNKKLEVIRVDVNSNMTAAMKAELDARVAQLILMRENAELKKDAGIKPSANVMALIKAKEARINELKATLKDRLTHTEETAAAAAALAT